MRVLHISYSDKEGGAAIGAYRIHRAMESVGLDSRMWVKVKKTDDPSVFCRTSTLGRLYNLFARRVSILPLWIRRTRTLAQFSTGFAPLGCSRAEIGSPDVLNIHWCGNGTFDVGLLRHFRSTLTFITLHDYWPLTGGCHYPGSCIGFHSNCDLCPALFSGGRGIASSLLEGKLKSYINCNKIRFVATSEAMKSQVGLSRLGKHIQSVLIPLPIDQREFYFTSMGQARSELGIDPLAPIVVFGAFGAFGDPRKGGDLLLEALKIVTLKVPEVQLVTFGDASDLGRLTRVRTINFGIVSQTDLQRKIYASGNVMIVPSRDETFGQTALEANSCGTPVVCFARGGLTDVVGRNGAGILVQQLDPKSLASGILEQLGFVEDDENRKLRAQRTQLDFGMRRIGSLYRDAICSFDA